ncbi:hypothetical protein VaNZ11_007541 [Volvox africanus]|uniref:B30.2/SPRY domain-containing protein n=1 Tax=Volvox africanus TaxID=51714 RepID=A0ABQ5S3P9_9CHLO|nr:hypothetical protein VaNZ11_007541 [Volvox africanus]
MGCGTSRDAVPTVEKVVAQPTILDDPKPVVEEAGFDKEAESSLKVIHEAIVARGLKASALGPPAISSAEECMVLNRLPECLCDLHDGMPPAIQQTPMRLLKITAVMSWTFLKVYEEIDPVTECLQVPYVDTDDDIWKEVVTVSWRWSEQKPAVYQQAFSPMSPEQFLEFSTLLKFAQENGIKYAWIDWSCVPQYAEDSMIEVHRSKVFYARARAMRVLPTFRPLPAEGPVRLILVKAKKVLSKRAEAGSIRCAVAASIIAAILAKNLVAGREYFGRVWTLAERMARFGRNEGLCQWLSLESWLGMVVDAMLKSTEDKTSSVIYKKMLGTKAAGLLEAVLAPLAAAVRVGSVQTPAAEGLETKVAELCMAAVSVWLSPNLLAEAPTSNWLHTYLGEEARSGVYQAWREADRVWAIYSYFCWKQNLDQRSAEGLRIALEDLVDIAAGDRSTYVRGMFAQLGVDENATPVMEIIPQPGKHTRPSSSRSVRPPSANSRPPSAARPPSARTQEEIEKRKKEEEAIAAAAERRRKEEAALTASLERRRLEEEAATAAAVERRRQEEAAMAAASERRKAEEAAAAAAAAARKAQEEAAAAAAAERRKLDEAAAAAAAERTKQEEAAAAAAAARKKQEEEAAATAAAEKKRQDELAAAIAAGKPTVGAKVTIKYAAIDDAKSAQAGHGGWSGAMEKMLGKTGVVESVDKDGDVRVKMDDGSGSMLWNPSLVMLGGSPATVLAPSALSSVRIGRNAALNDKYTVRFVANSSDVGAVQADYPAPPSCLVYYFEITVVEPGSSGTIGIGFAHSSHNVTRHVGWDAGTFGFHGDDGKTFLEGRNEYYGFKFGKGDVVGAALDFQRKEIFFTKNGTKGKAISISISQALYPTVSLHSSGEVVSVNFGQKPFSFNTEPFKIKVGGKVAIKSTSVDTAKGLQVGHGGWGSSMEKMLGKPGVVESVDKDGDVRVKMDDGSGTMLWNPALVLPNAAMMSPFTAGAKVTIKSVAPSEAQAAQSGHGGWASSMEQMLGKTGVVESVDKDGDVRVKMDDGSGSMLWNPSLVILGGSSATVLAPSALSSVRIGRNAALNDKYTVRFVANSSDVGAVQADYPAPPSCLIYYFEITVVAPGSNGTIGVGFAHSSHNVTRHVGWDAGTFGFHGDDGKTFLEGRNEYYGFKFGKGDVVGAALDFQRKEIFFTKNGTKGKAISISISQALYPTVSLHSSGEVVSVNFGQKPFSFNTEPFKIKVGGKMAIKSVAPSEAQAAQSGHGGWASSMEQMLGKTGVVESLDKDGDVRVKMDDGSGTMLWNPSLLTATAAPGSASTGTIAVGAKVSIKAVSVPEAQAAQSGHGGWVAVMEKMLGMPGVVESIDKDGDVKVKMDKDGDSKLWSPALVLPGVVMPTAQLTVGNKAYIKKLTVDEGKAAQEGHGGWNANMGNYLGKVGTLSYKYADGDVKVKFEDGNEYCWYWGLVLPAPADATTPAAKPPPSFTTGAKVTIKSVAPSEAQAAQSGHGGWASSMEKMLGKTGVVESVDKDGDVRVKMDDGSGSMLWNPSLITLESGCSTASLSVGSKATIKCVRVDVAKEAQNGHGGFSVNMSKYLGKTGTVSYKYQDGDVKIRFDSGDEFCWSHELVHPATSEQFPTAYDVGTAVLISNVTADEARAAQDGHGGWSTSMANYLGKTGTVSYKYADGDMKVKFTDGNEYCWFWGLVGPAQAGGETTSSGGCKPGAHKGVWRGPETKYWCSTATMTEGALCAHGSEIIKAPHWSCCGCKDKDK